MTIHNSSFNSISANDIQIDKDILSSHWKDMAENVNLLYSLATGEDLPGTTASDGHDHDSNGGPVIPFFTSTEIGYISTSRLDGSNDRIPFCRMISSSNYVDYLNECGTPYPVIDGSRDNTYTALWFVGDVEDSFADGEWITFNDGVNTGRYVYKMAIYYSDVNATKVFLFDSLSSIPTGGETVRVYGRYGDRDFYLYLPAWAEALKIKLPLTSTLSVSYDDGEIYYAPKLDADLGEWFFRARIYSGSHTGEWLNINPSNTNKPNWCTLEMDLSELTKSTITQFGIEFEFNSSIIAFAPVDITEQDAFLWFAANNYPQRRNITALLTSVK